MEDKRCSNTSDGNIRNADDLPPNKANETYIFNDE